jgi:hypothetical protein
MGITHGIYIHSSNKTFYHEHAKTNHRGPFSTAFFPDLFRNKAIQFIQFSKPL